MRRDAFNAANPLYRNLSWRDDEIRTSVACTLVCACTEYPISSSMTSRTSVLGNFRAPLIKGENLSLAEAIEIEDEIFQRILCENEWCA
jgi:hypothetical protein